jgi:hypothetical protein
MRTQRRCTVGWWVAEKDAPLAYLGPTDVNQEAAKTKALAKSKANPGTVFQVRYHMNANAPAEVRWEAVDGGLTEVTGDRPSATPSGITALEHPRHDAVPPSTSTPPPAQITISNTAPRVETAAPLIDVGERDRGSVGAGTMRWPHYVAYFFGGAFLANAVPHFVNGVSGRPFQSPFASPPGEGLSSSPVNVLWGLFNLAVGYVLVCRVGSFELRRTRHVVVLGLGVLLMAIMLSRAFGKFYGGL